MNRELLDFTWQPKNHGEFLAMARADRVDLNPLDEAYPWLYENVLPRGPQLFFNHDRYRKKVIKLMSKDYAAYHKVLNAPTNYIDLLLFK